MVPLTYVQAVARAGARPLLIAPTPADQADPSELLGLLDGVLVTGGADVDPSAYGERRTPRRSPSPPIATRSSCCSSAQAAERDLRASASAAGCRSSTSPTAARSSSTCPSG